MRILVYGAGVLGCELAHVLMQNKKNVVTLLARGEWKEMIDQKGLVIRHWVQRKTTTERKTVDTLAPDDYYDLVFVVVQAGQLPDVLPVLKANKSQYFVFVGNNPQAKQVLEAMQRPADKIAFGFQNTAGRRERDRVVSVHTGVGMTVGGATTPLSGTFRTRLKTAFDGAKYKLTFYGDMDEWLKCHIAFVLPACYVCYACNGDLHRATKQQRGAILDAAYEGCEMLKALGIKSEFKGGLRVTTPEAMDVVRMVLTGKVSRELVGLINAHGPLAVGLSGEDGGLFSAMQRRPIIDGKSTDIGLVGDVVSVDASAVEDLVAAGRIPVVSSVAPNEEDATEVLNVNADSAAAALAAAVGAHKLVILTDVDGLYADWPDKNSLIGRIGVETLRDMLPDLESGMRPKMEACVRAIDGGVPQAHVIDGRKPHSILNEIFTSAGIGTMVMPDEGLEMRSSYGY